MNLSTDTFSLKEYEKGNSYTSEKVEIRYCSYCGEKATRKDIGSSHNHRWEEEIIYFCSCEKAEEEKRIKSMLSKASNEVFLLEKRLIDLQKETNNYIVNKMKCDKEIRDIKNKYNIK